MRICLIKTSSMGDVIHTLPALTDAQRAVRNFRVDWVVEENFAEIPRWHSAVDNVIPIALRRWRKSPCSRQTRQQWQAFKQKLQENQYDLVIDAQGLMKSAFFATRLAQGEKHGYNWRNCREPIASLFYDKKHAIAYQQHAVERIRQLFAQSLAYALPKQRGDYGIAPHFQQTALVKILGNIAAPFGETIENSPAPYALFIHSTTRDDKHWPEAHWRELIELLAAAAPMLQIRLPWGNETERARAIRLSETAPNVQVLPKLTLSELANQIAHAQAVVSVDTGLAHLTAALAKPNLTLYGATDPKLIGCYGENQHYLFANSMVEILPNQVLTSFCAMLPERA